jgi:threonine synthase
MTQAPRTVLRASSQPDRAASVTAEATVAEGIAIGSPARGHQVLAAVRDTAGRIVTVTDDQIRTACKPLARAGLYVEPTAAASWAAVSTGAAGIPATPGPQPHAVVPLCGSGLKSAPRPAVPLEPELASP